MNKRGPKYKLSPKQAQKILQKYTAGASLEQLAKLYKVNHQTISNTIKRIGGTVRPNAPVFMPKQDIAIRRRYDSGETASAIAREFGVTPPVIIKAIIRAGGKIRTRQESFRIGAIVSRKRIFTEEQVQEIERRFYAGESAGVLSAEFGVDRVTVLKYLHQRGLPVRGRLT